MLSTRNLFTALAFVAILSAFVLPAELSAHCDGLDGPVVKAAQKALETENVNLVLVWVQKEDEATVKAAFQKTIAVRKLGTEIRELADLYFFETLVRIHRAGEGAPYTGLKPAGIDHGPAIPAADKALENGSADSVMVLLMNQVKQGIQNLFAEAVEKRDFEIADVEAGRDYVMAYVQFIHYVEGLYEKSLPPVHDHLHPAETDKHEEKH